MIQLYPDQSKALAEIKNAYGAGKRAPLFVAPCAFGKTYTFAAIARGAVKRGKSVLILAHRAELIDQISKALTAFNIDHGFICAKIVMQMRGVMIASVPTLHRRLNKSFGHNFSLIIVDEAHHVTRSNTFGKTLAAFQGSKLLGVTATPCRLSGEGLGDVFDHMVIGPTAQELIDAGRLSPFKLFAPPTVDLSNLRMRGGDYKVEQTTALMDKPKITGDAVSHYIQHASGKPFVAFCTSIEHAMNVAQGFRDRGIEAACIHGGLNEQTRKQIVEGFRAGRIAGLTSVDLISEGFDVPGIVCGLFLRPTASKGLFIQQFGRCLRLSEGKTHAVILDHVGNCTRHGIPTDPVEWTLEGTVKKPRTEKPVVRIRICPKCYAANKADTLKCQECGHEWAIESRTVEQIEGNLVEWVPEKRASIERIEEWRAKSLDELQAIAARRGYKPGWAYVRWQSRLKRVGAA